MLNWDDTDVLTVLEVIPDIEEYEICHKYIVKKGRLELRVTVYQYDGNVFFELYSDGVDEPLFEMELIDCNGVLRKVSDQSEWLEFAPSKCFGEYHDKITSIPYGVRVKIKPNISISLF